MIANRESDGDRGCKAGEHQAVSFEEKRRAPFQFNKKFQRIARNWTALFY